jgi:PIN domain nuclease of toxin-antitoxin system
MNLLLDTHIILWWMDDNELLPEKYRLAISDKNNICFVSAATIWEISIKSAIGKLVIPDNYLEVLLDQNFKELLISWQHAGKVKYLPMFHNDPFDRLIIAQTIVEDLTLLSVDDIIPKYDVKILGT